MKVFGSTLSVAVALGAILCAGQALAPAKAGLGDTAASVQADRVSVKGQLRARSGPGYTVQEITAATGTVVREYVSPAGVVFAVSWSGPAMPNLQQMLGTYFDQYQIAVKAQRTTSKRAGHNHVEIRAPSLVVHAGGHMRQYSGLAYVPSLVPQNLSISDLH
ncbi:MAG: DUF2844 domain-containing protein [Gammaproteobacteria bacterium]|nr:DUF2844 domain-containing protein [Gammaproteobacteria bacterium]